MVKVMPTAAMVDALVSASGLTVLYVHPMAAILIALVA